MGDRFANSPRRELKNNVFSRGQGSSAANWVSSLAQLFTHHKTGGGGTLEVKKYVGAKGGGRLKGGESKRTGGRKIFCPSFERAGFRGTHHNF